MLRVWTNKTVMGNKTAKYYLQPIINIGWPLIDCTLPFVFSSIHPSQYVNRSLDHLFHWKFCKATLTGDKRHNQWKCIFLIYLSDLHFFIKSIKLLLKMQQRQICLWEELASEHLPYHCHSMLNKHACLLQYRRELEEGLRTHKRYVEENTTCPPVKW